MRVPRHRAWRLLSGRMAVVDAGTFALDLGFADVMTYEHVDIVVFRCGCRWLRLLAREPGKLLCKEHDAARA